jgi:DNA-binding helix-hairpin-helix protein with protein kinase domain
VVYGVLNQPQTVAKVFRDSVLPLDSRQLDRLQLLAGLSDPALLGATTIPTVLLYDASGRAVGYLMENLYGWRPLHQLYQPKTRLRLFPWATHTHLIQVARRMAAAVDAVHRHDLVIGDLNEANALVSPEGDVRLIDVDSFQVKTPSGLVPCEVARPEYLAPELHGLSLDDRERFPTSDRFGLAVLVFQLLALGRHPFAGRPRKAGSTPVTLEEAMRRGWFPHAEDSPLMPTAGFDWSYLSPRLQKLFLEAFTNAPDRRPFAAEWVEALNEEEHWQIPCARATMHTYFGERTECAWCAMESRWKTAIFAPRESNLDAGVPLSEDEVESLAAEIVGIPVPDVYRLVPLEPPKPKSLLWVFPILFTVVLVPNLLRYLLGWSPQFAANVWLVSLLVVMGGAALLFWLNQNPLRIGRISKTIRDARRIEDDWSVSADPEHFLERRDTLMLLLDRYRKLRTNDPDVLRGYQSQMLQPHLNAYLKKYSVLVADSPSVHRSTLTRMHLAGVSTAADVNRKNLRGFSLLQQGIDELLEWRVKLERQYWDSVAGRLPTEAEEAIQVAVTEEEARLRTRLLNGRRELLELAHDISQQQLKLGQQYEEIKAALSSKRRRKALGGSESG